MSLKKSNTVSKILSFIIWLIVTLLGYTWKITIKGNQSMSPGKRMNTGKIYCFWHSHLLPLAFIFRNTKKTAVVSRSNDGQLAADIARLWNHGIIAGSSHRGGSSVLRQCTKVLKQKGDIVITPDGPRGPRETVKPGVAQLAHICKAEVVILSANPRNAWLLKTWDNFMVPKPFTHITVYVSDPVDNSGFIDSQNPVDDLRIYIQEKLDESTKLA